MSMGIKQPHFIQTAELKSDDGTGCKNQASTWWGEAVPGSSDRSAAGEEWADERRPPSRVDGGGGKEGGAVVQTLTAPF